MKTEKFTGPNNVLLVLGRRTGAQREPEDCSSSWIVNTKILDKDFCLCILCKTTFTKNDYIEVRWAISSFRGPLFYIPPIKLLIQVITKYLLKSYVHISLNKGLLLWCLAPLSTILQLSVLLVKETEVPGENHQPAASHWQTLLRNVINTYKPSAFEERNVFEFLFLL